MHTVKHPRNSITDSPLSLLTRFEKWASILALLADCRGCIIERNDSDGHPALQIYIPADPEALASVVHVLNHSDVEWDNLLISKIDELAEHGLATIPLAVFWAIAAAVHRSVRPDFPILDAIHHLNAHLLQTVKGQAVSNLNKCIIETFIEAFCQQCQDTYDSRYGQRKKGAVERASERKDRAPGELWVFKVLPSLSRTPKDEYKVELFLFKLGMLMDICKVLCKFLDRQEKNRSEEAKSQMHADIEWLSLLYIVFRANIDHLCYIWSEQVIGSSDADRFRERNRDRKYSATARVPPPTLCGHLVDLILLERPTLLRRDVHKLVDAVLKWQRRPKFEKLDHESQPGNDQPNMITLNGKLRNGQSFQILAVDAPGGDVFRMIPSLANLGGVLKFIGGFVQASGLGSRNCTRSRKLFESLRQPGRIDVDLPEWWDEYFAAGEYSNFRYLNQCLDQSSPVEHGAEQCFDTKLSTWVCRNDHRNRHTLNEEQHDKAINLSNDIDIIFSNNVQNFIPEILVD